MKRLQPILFLFITALFSVNAMAVLLFDDDFDEDDITGSHLNFTGLNEWVITDGTVDAFVNGGFGLSCPSTGCLDLDGSTGDAVTMETDAVFNFVNTELYLLELIVSGNQRGGSDSFAFGVPGVALLQASGTVASTDPFSPFTFLFTSSSSSVIEIEHAGGDNFGVILDRVRLCTVPDRSTFTCANGNGSVPEPGTIVLIGLGLAGLGFARRKKA